MDNLPESLFVVYLRFTPADPKPEERPTTHEIVSIHPDEGSTTRKRNLIASRDRPPAMDGVRDHFVEEPDTADDCSLFIARKQWVSTYPNGDVRSAGYQEAPIGDGRICGRVRSMLESVLAVCFNTVALVK